MLFANSPNYCQNVMLLDGYRCKEAIKPEQLKIPDSFHKLQVPLSGDFQTVLKMSLFIIKKLSTLCTNGSLFQRFKVGIQQRDTFQRGSEFFFKPNSPSVFLFVFVCLRQIMLQCNSTFIFLLLKIRKITYFQVISQQS